MEMQIMTPSQLTRGIAIRRYAFGKPVQQIADEAGLRYEQVLGVLKGQPIDIAVAARLTGYLRTPMTKSDKRRKRVPDEDLMSAERRAILKRIVRMRILARRLGKTLLGKSKTERYFGSWTDDELRTYCWNAEDAVKEQIMKLYPVICDLYKLSDKMAPYEWLERIDALKSSAQARAAIANHVRVQAQEVSREPCRVSA